MVGPAQLRTPCRRVYARLAAAGALLTCAAVLAPASADAAITLGRSPLPERTGVATANGAQQLRVNIRMPGVVFRSPINGVVVRWRVRGGNGPGTLDSDSWTLRIMHLVDGFMFLPVASSAPQTVAGNAAPSQVYTSPTRLRISVGDEVGVTKQTADIPIYASPGGEYTWADPVADGMIPSFHVAPSPNTEILVNADVEPDVDNDGYGDETQDGCPSNAGTHGACPVVPPAPDTVKPVISGATLNKTKTTKGLTFKLTLSEPAKVDIVIKRKKGGRKVGGKCRKQTAANKQKKPCIYLVKVGTVTFAGVAGANKHKWSGKLKGKQVRPGRYRADITATDAANNRSKVKRLSFKVVRKKT